MSRKKTPPPEKQDRSSSTPSALISSIIGVVGIIVAFVAIPFVHQRISSTLDSKNSWTLLYHLGGNGPWIPKIDGVIKNASIFPPEGCSVEQVHMLSRHAERYPTTNAGGRMLELLQRIKDSDITFKGDLEFINNWQYFAFSPSTCHNELTTTGPYAGTLSAFRTGTILRTRYPHLFFPLNSSKPLNFWASDSDRVIETAKYFATGLWGLDWSSSWAKLHVIPETADRGGNTLTPGVTCLAYLNNTGSGRECGYRQLWAFRDTYLPAISARFHEQNPGIRFTNGEIYSMQEMCGFDTLVRGSSPWCDIFTFEDWLNFEYARDVLHYYRTGPGNKYSGAMGWLWLNATANLLAQGPEAGRAFLSFVHDGDIIPALTALNLFPASLQPALPTTHRLEPRKWHTSQLTPMAGRAILELLSCSPNAAPTPPSSYPRNFLQPFSIPPQTPLKQQEGKFIRLNINDGIVPLRGCDGGPGGSCELGDFVKRVKEREEEVGTFGEVCGLGEESPGGVDFLHQ